MLPVEVYECRDSGTNEYGELKREWHKVGNYEMAISFVSSAQHNQDIRYIKASHFGLTDIKWLTTNHRIRVLGTLAPVGNLQHRGLNSIDKFGDFAQKEFAIVSANNQSRMAQIYLTEDVG